MTRAALAVLVALGALCAPAGGQVRGVDHIASDGVELIKNDRTAGSAQGTAVAGDKLLTWGPTHLSVYDISDPANPQLQGAATLEAANEGTEVVTNGRIAAIAQQACSTGPDACVQVFDVSGSEVKRLSTIPASAFMASCVLDCRYLWLAPTGEIVDLGDPTAPKIVGDFMAAAADVDVQFGCLQAREVKPGLVLLACDPVLLLSTLPEHGGSPTKPRLLATGNTPDFEFNLLGGPHSATWPRAGADRFMLTSTETALHPECTQQIGAFVTWDARPVIGLTPGSRFTTIDQWRPSNGSYTDGRSPYNLVGCSPHFLDEHPAFRDGGLVALATLENGVRFLEVTGEGKIAERGWFLGAGGTAASPTWHPDGKHLYVADYARGLDVLRYSGPTYASAPAPAGAGPAQGPPVAPKRRFRVAGVQSDRRRGRATLAIEVPSAGLLEVAPKAGRTALRRQRARVDRGGLVRVTIGATGRAARTLARRRRLRVSVHLTFTDSNGASRFLRSRLTLRRAR